MQSLALLFGFGLALRILTIALLNVLLEMPLARIAVLFDGHAYITIAQTFPSAYGEGFVGETAWMPAYPALIALLRPFVQDYAVAALSVSALCSAALGSVLYLLLNRTPGAFAAGLLAAVTPPIWITASTHGFSEPVCLLALSLAFLALKHDRFAVAVVSATLAAQSRHSALLFVAILGLDRLLRQRIRGHEIALACIPALSVFALDRWHGHTISDYPGLLEAHAIWWVGEEGHFGTPLRAIWRGFWNQSLPLSMKLTNGLTLLGLSVGGFFLLRQRSYLGLAWLSLGLCKTACLSGPLAFPNLPRFLLPYTFVAFWPLAKARIDWRALWPLIVILAALSCLSTLQAAKGAESLQFGGWKHAAHLREREATIEHGPPKSILPRWPQK